LGDKAGPRDIVIVAGRRLAEADKPLYLMLHKPRGYVTTMSDERGRKCVADLVRDAGARVFPVGRLDTASEGLLLMTNDGDFANAVAHPAGHLPKTYRVTLRGTVKEEQLAPIAKGMALDGDKTAPADVRILAAEDTRTVAEIILYEGRNRQIRRMCEQLGLEVARLKRTAVGQLRLGLLPAGKWRALTEKEVRALQKEACFPNPERA
ncbi:MAG: rRNA pseudouridine synthase, partial [Oscillospiraceae bacterium]|nr:rRNA pseudouridine synthase [Oscillospiraceae bacterium]